MNPPARIAFARLWLTFAIAGMHFCLGAALARLEGRVALDEVLKRFPDWEVDYENAEQARTTTVPYSGWSRVAARSGGPCVVGSLQRKRAPCRRGRPAPA